MLAFKTHTLKQQSINFNYRKEARDKKKTHPVAELSEWKVHDTIC